MRNVLIVCLIAAVTIGASVAPADAKRIKAKRTVATSYSSLPVYKASTRTRNTQSRNVRRSGLLDNAVSPFRGGRVDGDAFWRRQQEHGGD